jgi:SAM-dependent methyltransferase
MNAKELEANKALTEWTVQDLNKNKYVQLPYENNSFDVVMCQLSIDYLIHPLEVMKEVSRVLKPGGKVAILISNRLFLTKAVGLWTGSDDIEHVYTVGSYLHYCGGGFTDIKAEDLSTRKKNGKERMIVGDPLYVITATKS